MNESGQDWQAIAAIAVVLGTMTAFAVRAVLRRRKGKGAGLGCASGCGCGPAKNLKKR